MEKNFLNPILRGGGQGNFLLQQFVYLGYSEAIAKFQCPTMPGTGLKVCVGGMV